ncbi:phage major capsid protein [Noviherbaspirillum malthae]|uniref:phage major capsid protein n=1 Tax=Noviherbaspirillum malthae TaxID=1260987 RepID=UPI00188FE52C|nr:phage major capsid protein [Noviherbaspirillum malthae]
MTHSFKKYFTFGFVLLLAVMAICALTGHPLVSPETLAGLGMLPVMGNLDVQKTLGELTDVAKAAKETVEQVRKSHTELDGRVAKLQEEISAGKADAVTKAAFQDAVAKVEKAENALDKLNQEVTELAQKAANILGKPQTAKTLGQLAAESEVAKTYKGGSVELCTMAGPLFAKANVTSDAASAGVLVDPYRVPGILMSPDTPLTVRDLFTAVSISSNAVEWVQEKLFTNNAGPQAAEAAAKNESGITFEKKTSAIETIAHWIPASRQILADAPQLRGVIDGKLRTGLKLKEDLGLLFGDGTNGNLLGLVPQATAYSAVGIPAGATKIDHLRWAILQVTKAKYPATFAVLSLDDWALIQMMKTDDGAYIFGSPTDGAAPRIWGKRVVESYGLDSGDFVVGSSLAATIYDREEVSVRVAEQHGDFFIKNMVAILCEERLGFTVERPAAIVSGTFPA